MQEDLAQYLKATALLDYHATSLLHKREHILTGVARSPKARLRALYDAVVDLPLGYNRNDNISASHVLADGYGQCNTKTILLMALARGAGIPCRVHAYRLTKEIQRARHPAWLVAFMPKTTLFLWPEFWVDDRWQTLQKLVHEKKKEWKSCPFDGARFMAEPLEASMIINDHGVWPSPDDYFRKHKPTVTGWRTIGFRAVGRRLMNKRAQIMC